jgi:hypothetical protein
MKCPRGHEAHLSSPDYGRGSEWVCYTCDVYGLRFSSHTPGVDAEQARSESDASRAASRANAKGYK